MIGKVIATEPDNGQSISFSIIEGNINNLFSIHSINGEIITTDSIIVTSEITIDLEIMVSDNIITSLSDTALVTIKISEDNSGIEMIGENKIINIYPNPAKNNFTLNFNQYSQDKYNLLIFNSKGHNVFAPPIINKLQTINTQNWSNGIYYLQIIDENGNTVDT